MPSELLLSLLLGSRNKVSLMGIQPMLSHRAPCSQDPMFSLILYCHYFEILNNSWIMGLTFSFCTRSCKLCSWSCQECTLPLQLSPWNALFYDHHHCENLLFSFSFLHVERKTSWQGGICLTFTVSRLINPLPGRGRKASENQLFFFPIQCWLYTLSQSLAPTGWIMGVP